MSHQIGGIAHPARYPKATALAKSLKRKRLAISVCLAFATLAHAATDKPTKDPELRLRPSGVLATAAAAAAAAADAANAAAAAAAAAAKAAAAAVNSIESLKSGAAKRTVDRGPINSDLDVTAAIVRPLTDAATTPETPTIGARSFDVPDELSLVNLLGTYEIPVSVDTRGEFANNLVLTEDVGEGVDRAGETSLSESINAGRSFSRDVRVAVARKDQAVAQTGQSLALLLPSLTFRRAGGRETSDPTLDPDKSNKDHTRTDRNLTLRQPLVDLPNFFDYRRRGVIERSRDESRRAADGDAYITSVSAYLSLISTRVQAGLAKDFEAQLGELLGYIEKRAEAGASSTSDMARVRARMQAALSSRLEQEAAHAAAGVEYVRITNLAPRVARIPELGDLGVELLPASLEQAVSVAMETNPDITALVHETKAADLDRSGAKTRFMPRIDIELSDNKSLHAGGDISAAGQSDKRAMLVFNWSLFSGGSDIRYHDERTARHVELKYRLDDQRRRVVQTLSAQFATLNATRERLLAGYKELKAMATAADAMSMRMLSGNQSLLDLLDVYDRYYQAKVRLVTLHVQEMNSVAQIVRLVHGAPMESAMADQRRTSPPLSSVGYPDREQKSGTSANAVFLGRAVAPKGDAPDRGQVRAVQQSEEHATAGDAGRLELPPNTLEVSSAEGEISSAAATGNPN